MSTEIISNLIQFVIGPGLVAVLGGLMVKINDRVKKAEKAATVAADQVTNSHATNLRDDIDNLKDSVKDGFDSVKETLVDHRDILDNHGRDIRGLRSEVGDLRKEQRDQWKAIEDTQPRPNLTGRPRSRT